MRQLGAEKEALAVEYLKQQGYEIMQQNFYTRWGELDIVAKEDGYTVFIEVKYRKSSYYGGPEGAITLKKQKRICRSALIYITKRAISLDCPFRFDCLLVTDSKIELIKNAFPYCYSSF